MARPKTHQERSLFIAWIIEMVKKHGHATTKDIVEMFGLHRSTAEKYIRVAIKRVNLSGMAGAEYSATSEQLSTLTWSVSRTGEQQNDRFTEQQRACRGRA
jgi:DeoR/GlpR family transcriptional regulator of sugar metabolism